jgi:hypothetical protein
MILYWSFRVLRMELFINPHLQDDTISAGLVAVTAS